MITLFFQISGAPKVFTLPGSVTSNISNPRQRASRYALAGNEIQQYAEKSEDAGSWTYDQEIKPALFMQIYAAHVASGSCFISDGTRTYQAVIDIPILPPGNGRSRRLTATFYLSRRIV